MPQLGWTARADGAIDFYNRRWYEYTGTTFEEMEGWGWKTVHDPEMLPFVVARWENSLRTRAPFEMESVPLRPTTGRRATVLVVDDEPAVGLALSRILREHEVSTVSSVSDALALIASGKPFDVIFSDLMMPQVTGIEFYEELTRLSPREAVHVKGGTRNGSALCKIARRYISNRS